MKTALISPAEATVLGIPCVIFSVIIPLVGVGIFAYMIALRLKPLVKACPDPRLDRPAARFFKMIKYAVGQYRHPRYMDAGIIHIIIFAGFVITAAQGPVGYTHIRSQAGPGQSPR
ncbi:MAG: hypothetical protein R6U27_08235 [Desulfobacterales bacterium]